jgi:hypothetical protein
MLNVQLLDNSLIEQWGMWGFGGGRVNLRTHKARGGAGGWGAGAWIFSNLTLGLFGEF